MTTGYEHENNETAELLKKGNEYFTSGQLQQALECYIDYLDHSQDSSGLIQNKIGQIYYFQIDTNSEYAKESFKWYKKSAELDNAYGMTNIGRAYEFGIGTERNIYEALYYYVKAFEIDKSYAKPSLDSFLYNNITNVHELGVRLAVAIDYDFQEIVDKVQSGAELGDSLSILNMGYMYLYGLVFEESTVKARDCFLKITEGQYLSQALIYLGDVYHYGCNSIPQDYAIAFKYWEQSSHFNNSLAFFRLGEAYHYGWGVKEDGIKAIEYYRKANIGNAWNQLGRLALDDLSYAYEIEDKIISRFECAYLCFKRAANLGSVYGMCNLAYAYGSGDYEGCLNQENHELEFYWCKRAADLGSIEAVEHLGDMYINTFNPPDKLKALEYYQKAAKRGSKKAKDAIYELGIDMSIAGKTKENSYEKLQKLIGLENVKSEIESVINEAKIVKEMKEKGLSDNRGAFHMVFTGNPGTGKTVVARLVASIFREYGILTKGQLIEVDRSKLVASYVGQSTEKTQEVINLALGGVLFIDEAYTLSREGDNDYGQEAIDTILKAMEDYRDDFVVIVAGYTNEMYDFIHSNPGLEARFRRTLFFDDYSADELMEIFSKYCDDNGYKYDDKTKDKIDKIIKKMVDLKSETFANAREARNLYEDIIRNQRNRLAKDTNEHTSDDLLTIKLEDLPVDKIDSEHDIDEYMQELNSLVGLESVKNEICELADLIEIQKDRKELKLECKIPSLHMVFSGNPGTGKTTVARLISKMYSSLGVLSKGTLTEVSRADLVAGYSGQTAIKTKSVISKSLGGVLFIDEAYTLHQSDDDDFGQEAIDTILKEMEDHRNNLAVIIAGYTNDIKEFVSSNEGLTSRFNRYIEFEDYSVGQLVKIFVNRCESEKYVVSDELIEELETYLRSIDMSKFGNARGIRNMFEKIIPQQAKRLMSEKKSGKILTEDDYKMLVVSDFLNTVEKKAY